MTDSPRTASLPAEIEAEADAIGHAPPGSGDLVSPDKGQSWMLPVFGTVAILVVAEILVRIGFITTRFLPPPTTIFRALFDETLTSKFWAAVYDTLRGWVLGLGLAILLAVPIGIVVGSSAYLYRATRFIVDFIRPIPSIAILPVFMLVFGIGFSVKVYIATLASFSPLFFSTMYGVQDVDPVARDTARAYRLNRVYTFFFVKLPGSAPYIVTGLRLSASIALLLVVGTEMVVGLPGLGNNIIRAQYGLDLPRMYALIVMSGLLGITIAWCFSRAERFLLRWHPSQVKERAI
jgi:ABC-type nitrate/sulfonate/bicarbonate transport system permease component